MEKKYTAEKWKTVGFDFEYTNEGRLEISNFGRVRTFNKTSDGKILAGSMINGYRIIRLKLYSPRSEAKQKKLDQLQRQVLKLAKQVKQQADEKQPKAIIKATMALLDGMKKNLSEQFKQDVKERTIHQHFLIHRLVASYFLPKPAAAKTVVAHLDHNKLNNHVSNLKWMTPVENLQHQQQSPHVIQERKDRVHRKERSGAAKLNVVKVMEIKKLLAEGKPVKALAKRFKVTEMQIFRIRRGENWAEVKAAR